MSEEQNPQDKPKIIVDDDWKAQAQAEKDRLAAEQAERAKTAPTAPAAGPVTPAPAEAADESAELPKPGFDTLVHTLASQALFSLGAVPDPRDNKRYVNLDLAKFHIDTLKVLEEKTRNNLTDDEKKLLDQTLYELRSLYVQIAQRLVQQP